MDLYPRTIQHVKTWPYLQIRCLQLCPQPNGTLSTITFDSESVIMSHYPIENKVVNEVETNSSFTCKDESKSFGTKIVGINASKRIIRFWFQYFIEIISFYFSERWMVNKWRKYQKENDLVHAKRKRELLSLWCCTARKRRKKGCGVFLPEHMLKLAMPW